MALTDREKHRAKIVFQKWGFNVITSNKVG